MKDFVLIRREIETATGDVRGLVDVVLVGRAGCGERVFDLYRHSGDGAGSTSRGRRLVSAITERHLQRAQAAPLLEETTAAIKRFKRVLHEDETLSKQARIHEVVAAQKAIAAEVTEAKKLTALWRFIFKQRSQGQSNEGSVIGSPDQRHLREARPEGERSTPATVGSADQHHSDGVDGFDVAVRSDATQRDPNGAVHLAEHGVGRGEPQPSRNADSETFRDERDSPTTGVGSDQQRLSDPPERIEGVVLIVDLANLVARCFHTGEPSEVHGVRGMLFKVAELIGLYHPSLILIAAEGGHDVRTRLYPAYKADREKNEALQAQIDLARAQCEGIGWPVLRSPGYEADDVIATLARYCGPRATRTIVASTDKDLLQLATVPGVVVYDPYGIKSEVTAEHIQKRWGVRADQIGDLLALAGDKVDGVPGVDGIGEGIASQLLNKHETLERVLIYAAQLACDKKCTKTIKTLHEQRERALLSRELVELLNCPVADRWWTWPANRPRQFWDERLQKAKLFSAAKRLGEVLGEPREHHTMLGGLAELITDSRVIDPPEERGLRQPTVGEAATDEAEATNARATVGVSLGDDQHTDQVAASELTTGSTAAGDDAQVPDDVLRRSYADGLDWRERSPGIVSRMKARTPEDYCREFWEHETPELLAFARGALGFPFEDQRSKPAGVEQPMKFARATARALFE